MKTIICSIFFFLISYSSIGQYVGLDKTDIVHLKELIKANKTVASLYASLKNKAGAAINEMPNPVDTVVSEGHLASDPKKINTVKCLRDIDKIYALALVGKTENNKAYLQKASGFIIAWASINQPQGNPINDTKFEKLFMAYDMLRNSLLPAQKQSVDNWLIVMADKEIFTAIDKSNKTSYNNWNSHRLKTIGCIAYILNNSKYQQYIEEQLPIQVQKNLLPDGSGIDFEERDALHYHIYTLEPLICLATVVYRATQKDYYRYSSASGASIKKSIDFLVPFVSGEKTHAEFVNSHVAFDKKRADNKEPGYEIGAPFRTAEGVNVLTQAAYFEPDCMNAVKKASNTKEDYPSWQSVLNALKQ